ncbi:hypothetical protein ILYODFUR_038878 [Ilyodon furcidens]|uniref:Uncharacterized protein n=1 Tax=Ilyodon furcidens TaxID=33524 RepID=A0ABV0TRQ4_9TELE
MNNSQTCLRRGLENEETYWGITTTMDSGSPRVTTACQMPMVKGSGPSNQGCKKEGAVIRLTGLTVDNP